MIFAGIAQSHHLLSSPPIAAKSRERALDMPLMLLHLRILPVKEGQESGQEVTWATRRRKALAARPSYYPERHVRRRREHRPDCVAGAYVAARNDDAHDPDLVGQLALRIAGSHARHQPGRKRLDLPARAAQARHLDDGAAPEMKPRSDRQAEQIEAVGRDVLAEIANRDAEAGVLQLGEELGVDEVDLTQVRLGRVFAHPGAMLYGDALVGVILDPQAGEQSDAIPRRLAARCDRPILRFQAYEFPSGVLHNRKSVAAVAIQQPDDC
jgi:hypothetical protein